MSLVEPVPEPEPIPAVHALIRVWLPDRPGALGLVASRIGAMRGDIVGIDVLETGEGVAVDEFSAEHGHRQFGNMILSRLPVVQVLRHLLPWPADPLVPTMQRIALEVVLTTESGPLRVTTS